MLYVKDAGNSSEMEYLLEKCGNFCCRCNFVQFIQEMFIKTYIGNCDF